MEKPCIVAYEEHPRPPLSRGPKKDEVRVKFLLPGS